MKGYSFKNLQEEAKRHKNKEAYILNIAAKKELLDIAQAEYNKAIIKRDQELMQPEILEEKNSK